MSVRRQVVLTGRRTLYRKCGTCGRSIVTTADTPWVRQVPRDGKRQATVYYCSETCKKASYKHLFDGKAEERRRAREAKRDTRKKCRRYYAAHAEELKEYARQRRLANPGMAAADSAYARKKWKLLKEAGKSA